MNQVVRNLIRDKAKETIKNFELEIDSNDDFEAIISMCYQDLKSYAQRDPSSNNDLIYVFDSYSGYYAVFMHRLAHYIYSMGDTITARQLSEYCKLKTGIEIHPAAQIGKNFVLDHGIGTVIGETVVIGENCYILQSVILGSSNIANNITGARHPILGDNVEIGGFVKIYGPNLIGNNVKISPGAIIKQDIPDNTRVIVSSNYQIVKTVGGLSVIFSGYEQSDNQLFLFFKGGNLLELECVKVFIQERVIENIELMGHRIILDGYHNYVGEIVVHLEKDHQIKIWIK